MERKNPKLKIFISSLSHGKKWRNLKCKFKYGFSTVISKRKKEKKNSIFRFQEKKVFWDFKEFCDFYNLTNLIKVPICFKNPDFPTNIDAMLTTSYRIFHNSCAIETGLSDFHKMQVTFMKTYFQKKNSTIQYRDYSIFLQRSTDSIF